MSCQPCSTTRRQCDELRPCSRSAARCVAPPWQFAQAVEEGGSNIFTKDYIRSLSSVKMMDVMDGNTDHMVSNEEFMAYQLRLFDMMDRNKNGMIASMNAAQRYRRNATG